jgi:hypothetical protein
VIILINGLITKVVTTKKSDQFKITVIYTYDKDKLISLQSSAKFIINYSHNADGSVTYENFSIDDKGNKIKKHHGILSFKNKSY